MIDMGIYAKLSEKLNNYDVLKAITEILTSVDQIEGWMNYPLESMGGEIKFSKNNFKFDELTKDEQLIINSCHVVILEHRMVISDKFYEFDIYINLKNYMKDKSHLAWEIFNEVERSIYDIFNNSEFDKIINSLNKSLEPKKIVAGDTNDCININWEKPSYIIVNEDDNNQTYKDLVTSILPKTLKKLKNLSINMISLLTEFLHSSGEIGSDTLFLIINQISKIYPSVEVAKGSVHMKFSSEEDWDIFTDLFLQAVEPSLDRIIPKQEEIFKMLNKEVKSNLKQLKIKEDKNESPTETSDFTSLDNFFP